MRYAIYILLLSVLQLQAPFNFPGNYNFAGKFAFNQSAGGGGGNSASDDFNRANETPMAGNWTTVTSESNFNLASNAATPSNVAQDSTAYYTGTWNANQYSQANVTTPSTGGGGQGGGVAVRCSTSQRTYYRVIVDGAGANNIQLFKMLNGTPTTIWTRTVTYSAGALIKLSITGTTLTVTYNGATVGADATDTDIASGKPGIAYSSDTGAGTTMDNWAGADN